MRRLVVAAMAACLALVPGLSLGSVAPATVFTPGASGAGDPYFPLAGNGGYDVQHYFLRVSYDPASDVLTGLATIEAIATQDLSAFNFDFEHLNVRSITVNGVNAAWSRDRGELTIAPANGLPDGSEFVTVVAYDGVPVTLDDGSGFIHTEDGALVVGEPQVAATWFPVNDHPIDKAAITIEITVPTGLEAVSNGVLVRQRSQGGSTTWVWDAKEPMASYLAMMAIGHYDVNAYRQNGIRFWDAIDPDLFEDPQPVSGEQFAFSQLSEPSYKRLTRSIDVPAAGAQVSFWVNRKTEFAWDFVFVEAHTVGDDDWTTLPDVNGHNSQDTGASCPSWHAIHPFLTHYQDDSCAPTGTSGAWWAASGDSDGFERWVVDLSAFAGTEVEISITYASDDFVQGRGVTVDDVVVSTGEGTTSFEDDGDEFDGWTVPGAPEGSEPNPNDWIAASVADLPPNLGEVATGSLSRQAEIIRFLSGFFGPYPFTAAGGVVVDVDLGFALENQTRPIYAKVFFEDSIGGDSVVVHELAHQWVGDSLAVAAWQHIWLNEGFATYTEWLWSEHEGLGTVDEIFGFFSSIPATSPFWNVAIGDPGPHELFNFAVYGRGAMTLHVLRLTIGDEAFFELLRQWATDNEGGNVTTDEFIALAESISGAELDDLFDTWLFTARKPSSIAENPDATSLRAAPAAARNLADRHQGSSDLNLD